MAIEVQLVDHERVVGALDAAAELGAAVAIERRDASLVDVPAPRRRGVVRVDRAGRLRSQPRQDAARGDAPELAVHAAVGAARRAAGERADRGDAGVGAAGNITSGRGRAERRAVDGVLLLDKSAGVTSNAALQTARRLYRALKAGHTGTLDPLATGLLPVLFGEATKFGGELLDADKTYAAEIVLGTSTTTGDAEGEVVERRPVTSTRADIDRVLAEFRGDGVQVPPMYSALKRGGRPLYSYARAGESVERAARPVTIHALTLDAAEGDRLAVTVRCSKGTYIRVLAEDIGRSLGCGAHLARLRRLAIGPFAVTEAATVEALTALDDAAREARLLPLDILVRHLPPMTLGETAARRFVQGAVSECAGVEPGRIRVYGPGSTFLGVGTIDRAGRVRPGRLLRTGDAGARATAVPVPKTL